MTLGTKHAAKNMRKVSLGNWCHADANADADAGNSNTVCQLNNNILNLYKHNKIIIFWKFSKKAKKSPEDMKKIAAV